MLSKEVQGYTVTFNSGVKWKQLRHAMKHPEELPDFVEEKVIKKITDADGNEVDIGEWEVPVTSKFLSEVMEAFMETHTA